MEEKDKKECNCCHECDCGEDCNCTPDNKCCDDCTCDKNNDCKCENPKGECKHIDKECDCNSECGCGENYNCDSEDKCSEDCTCGEKCNCEEDCSCSDSCDCEEDCNCSAENKCNEDCKCESDKNTQNCENEVEDDKCKCGCGEDLEEKEDYFARMLRLQAEFDNYRKRTQSDISKAYQNGFNEAISQFLPALDSFKMASEYITDPNTLMGIQYIEKGILATLEKIGVQVIDTNCKFDPNLHQAIGSEVSPSHESGDIIKECFKGFKMGDKIIRYSQVIVAK